MKIILIAVSITLAGLTACKSSANKSENVSKNDSVTTSGIEMAKSVDTTKAAFPTKEIISGYIQLKNALAKDNGKDAATAANSIVALLDKVDKASLSSDQMKAYAQLQDDIKENAEHIGANGNKIEHQREHFQMLSADMNDLIKTFGTGGQTLYKDFCPMANDGKGADWISEIKEIKNPYLGSKMPDCGSVKETFK